MNDSNSDQEHPKYEPEEGLDPEESGFGDDLHSLFEGLSDAPDLSEDPSESESAGFFDWEDLVETIPYWSASSRAVDSWLKSEDPELEALAFEGFDVEDTEVHSHPLDDRQWKEGYLAPEGSSRRARKKPPARAREKAASSSARIERLARAIYINAAKAGRTNVFVRTANARKSAGHSYASADLAEARQLLDRLALAAQSAGTADEAAGLASALLPVAVRLYPQVSLGLWPALPALAAGTTWLARELYTRPQYRSFMAWLPKILESTLDSLAKRLRAGRPVTSRLTAALFARRVASLLVKWDRPSQRDQHRPAGNQDPKPGNGQNGQG